MRTTLLALAAACSFLGCQSAGGARTCTMHLTADDAQTSEEILKYVTPGMPGDRAKSILESQGFACTYERGDMGAGCLHCKITTAKSNLWSEVWHGEFWANVIEVDLMVDRGTVVEVKVSHQFGEPEATSQANGQAVQSVYGDSSRTDSDAVLALEKEGIPKSSH